jgi:catechol 2,3-dioxygenase-like lactoylglutathione lyase family enzyme
METFIPMIDHLSIGVRDIARARKFYDAALKPLGYSCLSESEGSLGYGSDAVALWIGRSEHPVPADVQPARRPAATEVTLRRLSGENEMMPRGK